MVGIASMEEQRTFTKRPRGIKATKEDQRYTKVREVVLYVQGKATQTMAGAQMRKVALLED